MCCDKRRKHRRRVTSIHNMGQWWPTGGPERVWGRGSFSPLGGPNRLNINKQPKGHAFTGSSRLHVPDPKVRARVGTFRHFDPRPYTNAWRRPHGDRGDVHWPQQRHTHTTTANFRINMHCTRIRLHQPQTTALRSKHNHAQCVYVLAHAAPLTSSRRTQTLTELSSTTSGEYRPATTMGGSEGSAARLCQR